MLYGVFNNTIAYNVTIYNVHAIITYNRNKFAIKEENYTILQTANFAVAIGNKFVRVNLCGHCANNFLFLCTTLYMCTRYAKFW